MTTLATYVEMPTPRREMAPADESLPADLTVAFGAAEAPVAGSVSLHDFLATAGLLTHAERMVLVETPAATRPPTSSRPDSRTTRSARCSASTTAPAPAAPTCGPAET